jgi:hypothetical protein
MNFSRFKDRNKLKKKKTEERKNGRKEKKEN